MKKKIRLFVIILALIFVGAQFIQPEKNLDDMGPDHLFALEKIPSEVMLTIKNACLDCHSDQTNYLWYHKISPVSWMINSHIKEGKGELNFSKWGEMSSIDQVGILTKISEEVERKQMPLKSYTFMHKKAKLSEEQSKALIDWVDETALGLLTPTTDD
ncbi:heme-binding domain-containing protein [Sunxiuqinia sp. A32]|uniref:heme-binding domain-containing protein n=1 Tax=Sunxiuqinia sp. A32 TaxID=3461496 RepID=UPI0040454D29